MDSNMEITISCILMNYRAGAPGRQRLDCMIIRFGAGVARASIEQQLQMKMGAAYPKRSGRR